MLQYGSFIDDCRDILKSHNNFKVAFTRRQANNSVHALARASISYPPCNDFHYPPKRILNLFSNNI